MINTTVSYSNVWGHVLQNGFKRSPYNVCHTQSDKSILGTNYYQFYSCMIQVCACQCANTYSSVCWMSGIRILLMSATPTRKLSRSPVSRVHTVDVLSRTVDSRSSILDAEHSKVFLSYGIPSYEQTRLYIGYVTNSCSFVRQTIWTPVSNIRGL